MSRFLKRCCFILCCVVPLVMTAGAEAQIPDQPAFPLYSASPLHSGYSSHSANSGSLYDYTDYPFAIADTADSVGTNTEFPAPKSVLIKSLIIPGWGQVINRQVWKVPIVYALLGGVTGYSIYLTKKYHDYRAAFYNSSAGNTDMRFGPTPAYLQNANAAALRDNRNFFRNRRDFIYITILLAYGLNAIDAYVFAHLRSFDVSEDLSMRPSLKPDILAHGSLALTLSFELFKK